MKFPLVLFVVLLAVVLPGTHAFSIGGRLGEVREKVEGLIEDGIEQSQDSVAGAQEKGGKLIEQLKNNITEFVQKAEDQLDGVLQKVDDQVPESALDQPNTECDKLAGTVRDTAVAAVANATQCVASKLEDGKQYIENILTISAEVTAELEGLREEVVQCTKGVNGITATVQAVICVNKVGAKAALVGAKAGPEVTKNVVQLGTLVSTFQASVQQCAIQTGFDTLTENINNLLGGVQECVKEAIDSAKEQSGVTEAQGGL